MKVHKNYSIVKPAMRIWQLEIKSSKFTLSQKYKLRPNTLMRFTLLYGQTLPYTELNETLLSSKFSHEFVGFFKSSAFCL